MNTQTRSLCAIVKSAHTHTWCIQHKHTMNTHYAYTDEWHLCHSKVHTHTHMAHATHTQETRIMYTQVRRICAIPECAHAQWCIQHTYNAAHNTQTMKSHYEYTGESYLRHSKVYAHTQGIHNTHSTHTTHNTQHTHTTHTQ